MDTSSITENIMGNALSQMGEAKVKEKASQLSATKTEEIREISKDFEAIFITQMLQHLFADVETNTVFGGGHGEDVFKTLLFDEYGKIISQSGGVGIAENVQRELTKIQEVEYENRQR